MGGSFGAGCLGGVVATAVSLLLAGFEGLFLAVADSDNVIHVWDNPRSGVVMHVLHGHSDEIRALAFSPDGSRLASAGADRVVHVWDVRDGKLVAGPNPRGKHAVAVIPGERPRLASTGGPSVRVWDVETGDEVAPTGLCPAFSVAASPNGKWLAVGGTDPQGERPRQGGNSSSLLTPSPFPSRMM